jgi:DNA (cytosine-5)-methyltransferase 1
MNQASAPKCLDLFCGIGGLTLGLHQAGISSVGGIDCWEDAQHTFERNLAPLRCMRADVTSVSVPQIEQFFGVNAAEIDVLAGGPPCQGFSTVGKRDSADPRNRLWTTYQALVGEIHPAYVIIENVEGLLVMDKGAVRDAIITGFNALGYRMACRLLVSAEYGIPQLRKRTVFLGWLDGLAEPEFPTPLRSAPVTVADAIFDLPVLGPSESASSYDKEPATEYQRARRGSYSVLTNHEAAQHSADLVRIISHIPDGGNRKSIPDDLQPKSGFHNSYSRLASWKPAVAITSNMRKPSSARAIHPNQHRGLTVREGLRLQSFDDDFVVLGSRTSQYLQVGNAVPPLLGRALGVCVLRAFAQNSKREIAAAKAARRPFVPRSGLLFDLLEQADSA